MLRLRIQKLGDFTVVHCAGRIAFPQAGKIQSEISRQLRTSTLVLDLADIAGVDAAGLGALVSMRAGARTSGTMLKLMNVTPRVHKLLRLTKLAFAFAVCSTGEMLDLLCRAIHRDEPTRFQQWFELPTGTQTGAHS